MSCVNFVAPCAIMSSMTTTYVDRENCNFSISPGGGLRKMAVPGQLAREFQG
jgi:hypothetical protein